MKHLEFSGTYRYLLLSGKKKATIRKKISKLKEGDVVFVHCGGEIIGKAKITSIERKRLDELTDEDAVLDGFKNREELIRELKRIYGDEDEFYVIKFEFEPIEAVNPHEFHYGNSDLIEIAEKALKELNLSKRDRMVLELFLKTGSIRKTASKLGGLRKRGEVRKVLRKCYNILKEIGKL